MKSRKRVVPRDPTVRNECYEHESDVMGTPQHVATFSWERLNICQQCVVITSTLAKQLTLAKFYGSRRSEDAHDDRSLLITQVTARVSHSARSDAREIIKSGSKHSTICRAVSALKRMRKIVRNASNDLKDFKSLHDFINFIALFIPSKTPLSSMPCTH